jgi:hypothetical protein
MSGLLESSHARWVTSASIRCSQNVIGFALPYLGLRVGYAF